MALQFNSSERRVERSDSIGHIMRRALSSLLALLLLLSLTTTNVSASGQTEYGDA